MPCNVVHRAHLYSPLYRRSGKVNQYTRPNRKRTDLVTKKVENSINTFTKDRIIHPLLVRSQYSPSLLVQLTLHTSSDLSSQSNFPSHLDFRSTQRDWSKQRNCSGGHFGPLQWSKFSSSPWIQSFLLSQTSSDGKHSPVKHWNCSSEQAIGFMHVSPSVETEYPAGHAQT